MRARRGLVQTFLSRWIDYYQWNAYQRRSP
jgi:hypothetical protein